MFYNMKIGRQLCQRIVMLGMVEFAVCPQRALVKCAVTKQARHDLGVSLELSLRQRSPTYQPTVAMSEWTTVHHLLAEQHGR